MTQNTPTPSARTPEFLARLDTSRRWVLAVLCFGAEKTLVLTVIFRNDKWVAVDRHHTGRFDEVPSFTRALERSVALLAISAPDEQSEKPHVIVA